MPPASLLPPVSLPNHTRQWLCAAVLFSVGLCAALIWLHYAERAVIQEAERVTGEVREARIDLSQGFLHLSLAGDERSPFRREIGLALLQQAITGLQRTAAGLATNADGDEGEATTAVLAREIEVFNAHLDAWLKASPETRAHGTTGLRIAFHALEHQADRLDLASQRQMRATTRALDLRLRTVIAAAVVLLAGICAGVYVAARNQRAAVRALQASRDQVRLIGDNLPDAYVYRYVTRPDGSRQFVYLSAGVERVHGLAAASVLADPGPMQKQIEPVSRQLLVTTEDQCARTLTDFELEVSFLRTDSVRRLLHLRSRPTTLADGSIQWDGLAHDITDRRLSEESMHEKDAWLRDMSAMAHIGGWAFDPATGEGGWTDEVARIHDMDPAEPTSRVLGLSVYLEPWRTWIEQALRAAVEQGQPYDLELQMVTARGNRKWVRTLGIPVQDDGRVVRLRGTLQDITDRKEAEQALRDSEARFRLLFEQAADGIIIVTREARYDAVNPRALELLGFTREELVGLPVGVLTPAKERDQLAEFVERVRRGEEVFADWRLNRRDGTVVETEISARRLTDGRGLIIMRDVTSRKQAESRAALQFAVTAALAEGGTLQTAVPRVIALFGEALAWEFGCFWGIDRSGQRLEPVTLWQADGHDFAMFAEATLSARIGRGEGMPGRIWSEGRPLTVVDVAEDESFLRQSAARADGLHAGLGFPVALRGEVLGVVEFFSTRPREVSPELLQFLGGTGNQLGQYLDRLRLEEQFRQAQKMEAIGTLAGGIAHDFNNMLAAILGYTSLARLALQGNREADDYLEEVARAGARATDLVRQILTFSRPDEHQLAPIDLRSVIAETGRLLRATVPSTIDFHVSIPDRLPTVMADATQVHQVIMNLGTNAWQAMRDRAGRLVIQAGTRTLGPAEQTDIPLPPGDYVYVAVQDTGQGMDAATKDRIFEPFFTTKPRGEGTGLGLAVVHGIMRHHGGAITVSSTLGEGSTFHLYFPVTEQDSGPRPDSATPWPHGKGQWILVVDDEPAIARATKRLLELQGYRVETALDPRPALELVQTSGAHFDLIITDYTLPHCTGLDLAREIRICRPDVPIILTTGLASHLAPEHLAAAGIFEVLCKPATTERLYTLVGRALNAGF